MKKLLSIVLALVMVLTFMVPAFAEGTTVVYYVNGAIDGDAVAATAGDTYTPDRMPTTAAPEGQYFVGWADANGEIVSSKTGIVVAEGENKLTAVYKSFAAETEVDLTKHVSEKKSNIGYLKNGKYLSYVDSRTGTATNSEYVTEGEESYLKITPSQYSGGAGYLLTDADGDVIQIKNNTKYQVVLEYSIPKNNSVVNFRLQFGAKIYKDGSGTAEAPGFRHSSGSEMDVSTKQVNFYGGVTGLTQKWHDNGGYYYRFGDTVENPATTDGWQKAVWNVTTPAYDANFLPVFALSIAMSSQASDQEFQIKSIKVIDTTIADVQYVVNGEVMATVSGLTAGATYTPDRMPTAETPEGKYFAGWKCNGEYVVDTVTLSYGANKLEAVYKDYVTGTVEADLLAANLPAKNGTTSKQVLLPMIYNGAYRGYVSSGGWAGSKDGSDATGTFVSHYNGDTWGANTLKILHDSEGVALAAKPSTTYRIQLTYRLVKYPETYTASYQAWKDSGESTSLRAGWYTYMMVGYNPAYANPDSFQNNNGQSGAYGKAAGEHTPWYDHGHGLGFWKDVAGDGEWHTEVFQITTHSAEKYAADGYLPVFSYCYNGPNKNYAVDFKSVVITEVAGTVNYYVGEEIEKSVGGLNIGSAFTPDYVPAATPEGTTFAGWKNAEGEIVNSLTVAEGDNNLYAYFKEATTVAYYVNGVQEGEKITGLNAGDTYAPDRMPTAAAPEGKYFAGWKYNGEYVVDAITIADGTNRLEAAYKDYATGTITADIFNNTLPKTTAGTEKVLMPSVVNGVYWGYADNKGWAAATDTTENGESFVRIGANSTWGEGTAQFIHNSDGTVLYAKPSTTYKIEFTYKIGAYPETDTKTYADWKATNDVDPEAAKAKRPNLSMYMNVGFLPAKRTGLNSTTSVSGGECAIASSLKATAQEHHTYFDHGPGLGIWKDVAGDGWVTETFLITTKAAATYEQYGLIPAFWYGVNSGNYTYKVDVKSIVVSDVSLEDDLQSATIAEKEVGYVKILDEVEDNATYKVTFNGCMKTSGNWSSVYALTANADNVNLNQSLIYGYNADHGVKGTMGSFGYDWVQTYTSFITTDLAAQEGNALYLYVTNTAMLAQLNLISIEKVEGVAKVGAAILVDQPADATQAIRYFYSYNTVNGNDIVIDGKTYTIASRGFLLADADKVGDKIVTRTTAAEENSGIIDANTTDLTKCWNYTDNGDGTVNLQFSTYVKGFKADEGTYNNTNRLYVKGYVVLTNGSVIYGEEIALTVADIANELGLVG